MDGNKICATWDDFDCLATSPAGFGDNITCSIADLIANSDAIKINDIVCSIEQEPFEKRAAEKRNGLTSTNTERVKPCATCFYGPLSKCEAHCCHRKTIADRYTPLKASPVS